MQLKSYKKQPKIGSPQLSYMIKSFQKEENNSLKEENQKLNDKINIITQTVE